MEIQNHIFRRLRPDLHCAECNGRIVVVTEYLSDGTILRWAPCESCNTPYRYWLGDYDVGPAESTARVAGIKFSS